jgi:hypothetical protein
VNGSLLAAQERRLSGDLIRESDLAGESPCIAGKECRKRTYEPDVGRQVGDESARFCHLKAYDREENGEGPKLEAKPADPDAAQKASSVSRHRACSRFACEEGNAVAYLEPIRKPYLILVRGSSRLVPPAPSLRFLRPSNIPHFSFQWEVNAHPEAPPCFGLGGFPEPANPLSSSGAISHTG